MSKYRNNNARAKATLVAECYADPCLFRADLTRDEMNEFVVNGPIPCEGGGVPGEWCDGCRFGQLEVIDIELMEVA